LPRCSALQGLLRKLGANFDDMLPLGVSGTRIKVRRVGAAAANAGMQRLWHAGCGASCTVRQMPCGCAEVCQVDDNMHLLLPPLPAVQTIIQGLKQSDDDTAQLAALSDLCELLSISTEESLVTFPVDQIVPLLVRRSAGVPAAQHCAANTAQLPEYRASRHGRMSRGLLPRRTHAAGGRLLVG
jgi:hypothetical protein